MDRRWWTAAWVGIWVGPALVQMASPFPPAFVVRAGIEETAAGQPWFLHSASYWLYHLAGRSGAAVDVALVVVELAIGLGVLAPRLRPAALVLALAFAALTWVVGQDLGGILSPGATDPGSAPVLVLLVLAGARPGQWRGLRSAGIMPIGKKPQLS